MAIVQYINISRADVYNEVQMQSHYVGQKGEAFEQIAITDENKELLAKFFDEGVTALDELIKHYISASGDSKTEYNRVLTLPDNWDRNVSSALVSSIMKFLVNYIISRWMRVVNLSSNAEAVFHEYAQNCIKRAYSLLFHRVSPSRKKYQPTMAYTVEVSDIKYSASNAQYPFTIKSKMTDVEWDTYKAVNMPYVFGYIIYVENDDEEEEEVRTCFSVESGSSFHKHYDSAYDGIFIEVYDNVENALDRIKYGSTNGKLASAEYVIGPDEVKPPKRNDAGIRNI